MDCQSENTKISPICRVAVVFLMALIAGCGSSDDQPVNPGVVNPQINSAENRRFEHDYFEVEPCSPDPIVNCTADLVLCKDGSATLLLTDIINGGTYTETSTSISTSWGVGDAPESIVFSKQPDSTLVDDQFGLVWALVAEGQSVVECE